MRLLGIDPGKNGAISILEEDGEVRCIKMPPTYADMWRRLAPLEPAIAAIEKVGPSPKMHRGVAFRYGVSYGVLLGQLHASGLEVREVLPRKWQASFDLIKRGTKRSYADDPGQVYQLKKKEQKQLAAELYPQLRVFHWNADSLLILEWLRRIEDGR